jgi:hypothetical protein
MKIASVNTPVRVNLANAWFGAGRTVHALPVLLDRYFRSAHLKGRHGHALHCGHLPGITIGLTDLEAIAWYYHPGEVSGHTKIGLLVAKLVRSALVLFRSACSAIGDLRVPIPAFASIDSLLRVANRTVGFRNGIVARAAPEAQ